MRHGSEAGTKDGWDPARGKERNPVALGIILNALLTALVGWFVTLGYSNFMREEKKPYYCVESRSLAALSDLGERNAVVPAPIALVRAGPLRNPDVPGRSPATGLQLPVGTGDGVATFDTPRRPPSAAASITAQNTFLWLDRVTAAIFIPSSPIGSGWLRYAPWKALK